MDDSQIKDVIFSTNGTALIYNNDKLVVTSKAETVAVCVWSNTLRGKHHKHLGSTGIAKVIATAASEGSSTLGGTIYCSEAPTLEDALLIVDAGLKQVYHAGLEEDESVYPLLDQMGVEYEQVMIE